MKTVGPKQKNPAGEPDYENGPRYARELLDYINSCGSLLDVGAGKAGFLVKEAKKRGFQAMGIDPLVDTDLEHFKTSKKFDVIVLKHVIEHVVDLNRFLSICRRLLKSDGVLLISCPNISSLMFYLFRQRWYGLQPSQHIWQFSPNTLRRQLRKNGFREIKIDVINMDYQVPGIKGVAFKILLLTAKIFNVGDQLVVVAG